MAKWFAFSRRKNRKSTTPSRFGRHRSREPDYVPENQTDSLLFKIGNKEIVRGMAECSELLQLIDKDDSYDGLYVDLVKKSSDVLDSYFWIDKGGNGKAGRAVAEDSRRGQGGRRGVREGRPRPPRYAGADEEVQTAID